MHELQHLVLRKKGYPSFEFEDGAGTGLNVTNPYLLLRELYDPILHRVFNPAIRQMGRNPAHLFNPMFTKNLEPRNMEQNKCEIALPVIYARILLECDDPNVQERLRERCERLGWGEVKTERYFSVDIESAGPIPESTACYHRACVVDDPSQTFYVEVAPLSRDFVPEAINVSGFDLARLEKEGQPPQEAMPAFRRWVEAAAGDAKPVFVGFNACYDWQFVNWYLESFAGGRPFGFGGVDIKSYFMGIRGNLWAATTSSQLPLEFQPDTPQTHNALDDARAQASTFAKLLRAHRNEST